jgi:hypothetical protein
MTRLYSRSHISMWEVSSLLVIAILHHLVRSSCLGSVLAPFKTQGDKLQTPNSYRAVGTHHWLYACSLVNMVQYVRVRTICWTASSEARQHDQITRVLVKESRKRGSLSYAMIKQLGLTSSQLTTTSTITIITNNYVLAGFIRWFNFYEAEKIIFQSAYNADSRDQHL